MKEKNIGLSLILLTVLIFSSFEVISKTFGSLFSPYLINYFRFLIGALFLGLILFRRGELQISLKDAIQSLFLGFLNVVLSMTFLQLSIYLPQGKAAITATLFSCNPLFVIIFAAIIGKEKLTAAKIIALILCLSGIFIILAKDILVLKALPLSQLLAIIAAVLFGLYTVLGRQLTHKIGSLKMNTFSFAGGALLLTPTLFLINFQISLLTPSSVLKLLYLGVVVTGIAYLAYFKGLSLTRSAAGSLVFFLKPVLATLFAFIFLGEKITFFQLAGTLFIMAGVLAGTLSTANITIRKKVKSDQQP